MAASVFNIALGRAAELYNRVDTNDPTDAVLKIILLAASGLETHTVLKRKDTITDVLAGTTNEATNTGYSRKVLTAADIVAFAPDDVNDRVDLVIPDQTFTGISNDGTGAIGAVVVCYDNDEYAGTDASVTPMTIHDFAVTPNGGDIIVNVPADGFYGASM